MTILDTICTQTRQTVAAHKKGHPEETLRAQIATMPAPRGFVARLHQTVARGETALITEIKRRSPSGGALREDLDPATLAHLYAHAGASCLSLLTDAPFFGGTSDDLRAARAACPLPVLRKDFIVDPWQVLETRAMGADAILLILAVLDDNMLRVCYNRAREIGLDVLLEVHDGEELERALALLADVPAPSSHTLLGINNRNLKTLVTDLATTERLAATVAQRAPDLLCISESGIRDRVDILRMARVGVHCFLVGESLLRQTDIAQAVRALRGVRPTA